MSVDVGWKRAPLAAVLGIITLTVWAAGAAGLVRGPAWVLAGVVLTALTAVAAGYVPAIRDAVLRRRAEPARLEKEDGTDQGARRRAGELPDTEPQEAVAICRELAAADPGRYRPDLADSLTRLGLRFLELGRPDQALTAEQEAVTIRRELAAAHPARYRPGLADSLRVLARALAALGRPQEAEAARREADLGH